MKTQNRFEMEKIDRNTWTWLLIMLTLWLAASVSNAFIAEHSDRTDQAERLVQAEISRGPDGLR
jgi:hypothetical protein